MNRGGIADLLLLRTPLAIHQNSWELSFWEVMEFSVSKNPLPTITSLSELSFIHRIFILLVQMKKVIPMNYGSSTNSWKLRRWVRLDQTLTMRDLYINSNMNLLTKFTSSSKSTEFKDILPWNIFQTITKTVPTSTRIVIGYTMKQSISLWIWWKVSGNWANNMIRISQ